MKLIKNKNKNEMKIIKNENEMESQEQKSEIKNENEIKIETKKPKKKVPRKLEFDSNTKTLYLPHYHNVCASIEFYANLATKICNRINELPRITKENIEERERLTLEFDDLYNRCRLLDDVRKAIEQNPKFEMKFFPKGAKRQCRQKCNPPRLKVYKDIKAYTNFIDFPSRKKLSDVLAFYEQLLMKIEMMEVIPKLKQKIDMRNNKSENKSTGLGEKDNINENGLFVNICHLLLPY